MRMRKRNLDFRWDSCHTDHVITIWEDRDAIGGWTISTLKALLGEALQVLSAYKIAQPTRLPSYKGWNFSHTGPIEADFKLEKSEKDRKNVVIMYRKL